MCLKEPRSGDVTCGKVRAGDTQQLRQLVEKKKKKKTIRTDQTLNPDQEVSKTDVSCSVCVLFV